MTFLLLVISSAFAGWTETAREHDCVFYKGDQEGNLVPLRAECDWAVPPDKLHALLKINADHDKYFSSVAGSDLVRRSGDMDVVRQVHVASGISDREVILDMASEAIPFGTRYSWTKSKSQADLTGDGVEVALDTGKWEVTAGGAGSKVVYELRYDAGGSVPGFLVRWFQGAGIRQLVGELRTYAETH